jgi:hypothetical protein
LASSFDADAFCLPPGTALSAMNGSCFLSTVSENHLSFNAMTRRWLTEIRRPALRAPMHVLSSVCFAYPQRRKFSDA